MSQASQEKRLIAVNLPNLRLRSIAGHEELSRLFSYQLEMECTAGEILLDRVISDIVGTKVGVRIVLEEGEKHLHGHIARIAIDHSEDGAPIYRAEMVPFFWFATQTSDCRIFQDKTIPEIITDILESLGFAKQVRNETKEKYEKVDYCVQYRETDFNFISRLMEQEGIFYFFEHNKDGHVLVFGDSKSSFKALPVAAIDYPLSQHKTKDINDHISDWERQFEFVSGKWTHTDYNFTEPNTDLKVTTETKVPLVAAKSYELFDYPGEYLKKDHHGKQLSQVRMEEEEQAFDTVQGTSSCRVFHPGSKFTIGDHPATHERGKTYLLTSVRLQAKANNYATGKSGGGSEYANSFTCIPEKVNFRPKRITPKPIVSGLQTAVVVGPKGQEIYTDQYGRVKVQFFWDREGKKNEKSSCWIRCAQAIAGKKWGFMAIPRIGQEVVVDFLEGDPDRPLIVGVVYNQEQMPAYDPKTMASRISLKSNSTQGGEGFNELMFEDKKDSELVFIHAQKDYDLRVRNDAKERIYGNKHDVIGFEKDGQKGGSYYERVFQDKHVNIKRHQVEHVEGNLQMMVGGGAESSGGNVALVIEKSIAVSIGKDGLELTNDGDSKQKIKGNESQTVDGDSMTKIGGTNHFEVKGERLEKANSLSLQLKTMGSIKADAKLAMEAGSEVHIKSGASLVLEGGASLTLKVGGNFIAINPGGIFIQGTLVGINSGGVGVPGTGCIIVPPAPPLPPKPTVEKAKPKDPEQAHQEKTGMPSNK